MQKKNNTWRLKEDLIQDVEVADMNTEELELYFKTNSSEYMSESLVWDAHKAYIRGILIIIGTAKKKESRRKVEELHKIIYDLEQRHKS